MADKTRVVLYFRIGPADNQNAKMEQLRDKAEEKGYEVMRAYFDVGSANKKVKRGLEDAIQDASAHNACVFAGHPSQLSRNMPQLMEYRGICKRANTDVIFYKHPRLSELAAAFDIVLRGTVPNLEAESQQQEEPDEDAAPEPGPDEQTM